MEYYFSGFDPQYGGMDWRSLRLVFAPHGEGWALVGIVHDEWGTLRRTPNASGRGSSSNNRYRIAALLSQGGMGNVTTPGMSV